MLNYSCILYNPQGCLISNKRKITLEDRSKYKITSTGERSYLFQVLIGLMLGDGHVHKNKSRSLLKKQVGKRTLNSRFQYAQATIRVEYLFFYL